MGMFLTRAASHDYGSLEAELLRRERLCTEGYWQDRVFKAVAQPGMLALSWQGDTEYELALAADGAADAAEQALKADKRRDRQGRTSRRSIEDARRDASLAQRTEFKARKPAQYAYSAYVFYKTREAAPIELVQIGSDLEAAYRNAPLHHYMLISRRLERIEGGASADPGEWATERPTFATEAALVDHLMKRVFPPKCPQPPRSEPRSGGADRLWLSAIGAAAAVLILSVAGWLTFAGAGGEDRLSQAEPASVPSAPPAPSGRLADLEGGIEDLRNEFGRLRSDMAALTADGATQADFNATARALESLVERLADAPASPASTVRDGLDRPPCLPVRTLNGRQVPEYLFTAVLSDAGITALARSSRTGGPDLTPFQSRFGAMGRTLSATSFRAQAEPILTAQPDCRHFVLLVEEEMGSASQYASQRQAVEDYFYIFRLQP